MVDAGWACPSWPRAWSGRDLPPWADDIASQEIAAAGAVGVPFGVGTGLAGPTLLAHGSEAVKRRFLRPLLTGEHTWCQLFSEPGNGSDLAGLTTRAERDGDEWVVNGQKLWSTSAHHADYGLLLARTDWDAPKHRGITYFVLPMHQPGVLVRPLRQMNGHASFNEIFLTDARVPDVNRGRRPERGVARRPDDARGRTAVPYGRGAAPRRSSGPHRARGAGRVRGVLQDVPLVSAARWAGRPRDRPRAGDGPRNDPVVRQELAALVALQRAHQWTMQRAHAARAQGRPPGPEGSLGKLAASVVARGAARVHARIAGAAALLSGPDSLRDGIVAEVLVSVPAQSIAGGTDEIQRNIIGERVLGLPKEPSVDRDLPFRDVPRN